MYLTETTRTGPNGTTYRCVLLRQSYREGGEVKNRTIANLFHCTPEEVAAIRLALQHKDDLTVLGTVKDVTEIAEGRSVGAVWTVYEVARRLVAYPNSAVNSIVPKTGYNALISAHVGGGNAMVSHHFVSQLVLFALIWLFIILHLTRPKCPVLAPATPTAEPEPLKPKRHRSNVPQPCEGLTHKPHCALCERENAPPQAPPV